MSLITSELFLMWHDKKIVTYQLIHKVWVGPPIGPEYEVLTSSRKHFPFFFLLPYFTTENICVAEWILAILLYFLFPGLFYHVKRDVCFLILSIDGCNLTEGKQWSGWTFISLSLYIWYLQCFHPCSGFLSSPSDAVRSYRQLPGAKQPPIKLKSKPAGVSEQTLRGGDKNMFADVSHNSDESKLTWRDHNVIAANFITLIVTSRPSLRGLAPVVLLPQFNHVYMRDVWPANTPQWLTLQNKVVSNNWYMWLIQRCRWLLWGKVTLTCPCWPGCPCTS